MNPADQAKEKFDEFRMHAELAAVFEGHRKFAAQIDTEIDPEAVRQIQRTIARLEKTKDLDTPLIPDASSAEAAELLNLPAGRNLSTNDYHIHRRPGEVMIVRWLAGDEVESFYERFQAHFDVVMNQFREEERQSLGWKQDAKTAAYLDALDKIEVRMSDRYLREIIRKHRVFVLSTQTADDLDILHLCDYLMGVEADDIVGKANALPEQPTERDRAWFFKLFALCGITQNVERMCFFAYVQKTDDDLS